jgi:hypothetical protein
VIKLSKVPEDMGRKVQRELQKALDQWTDQIPASGAYEIPEFQKIEMQRKCKQCQRPF